MSIQKIEGRVLQSHIQCGAYKCYLRLPNMKAVVYNVAKGETVQGLKQIAKRAFGMGNLLSEEDVKLVVNEVQLQEGMDLGVELFDNAIIHVIVPVKRLRKSVEQQQPVQEEQQSTLTLRIKQPPVKCPILTLPSIPLRLSIRSLKSRILQFYRRQYFDEKISKLDEDELYLVYAGRVMVDDRMLEDYEVSEDGVVYVVNGRQYVRVVTREEAERRVNQVKGRVKKIANSQEVSNQIQVANKQTQIINNQQQPPIEQHHQYQEQQQQQYQQHQQQQQQQQHQQQQYQPSQPQQQPEPPAEQSQVLNLVQSMVHDQDSQVEDETASDGNRLRKFIQRYDSKTGNIIQSGDDRKECDEFLINTNGNSFKSTAERFQLQEEQLPTQPHESQLPQHPDPQQPTPSPQYLETTNNHHPTDENHNIQSTHD